MAETLTTTFVQRVSAERDYVGFQFTGGGCAELFQVGDSVGDVALKLRRLATKLETAAKHRAIAAEQILAMKETTT